MENIKSGIKGYDVNIGQEIYNLNLNNKYSLQNMILKSTVVFNNFFVIYGRDKYKHEKNDNLIVGFINLKNNDIKLDKYLELLLDFSNPKVSEISDYELFIIEENNLAIVINSNLEISKQFNLSINGKRSITIIYTSLRELVMNYIYFMKQY